MSDPIERLTSLFERFPGIGPRQAARFVQFLLRSSPAIRRELAEAVVALSGSVHQCTRCMRFHAGARPLCGVCENPRRDDSLLAVVASDADLLALERSGTYRGRYFVLGGTISLASEKMNGLRMRELLARVQEMTAADLAEVILAFPANPEGDTTAVRVREELEPLGIVEGFAVTQLGRGLSTGSELEYADPETLKSALASRR
ncbi:recombination protein RecR [Candidatus Kaiserbacteria bacterium]|nr:recombination protein RecR [Candidatus Kaiserbacteria bacterium]